MPNNIDASPSLRPDDFTPGASFIHPSSIPGAQCRIKTIFVFSDRYPFISHFSSDR